MGGKARVSWNTPVAAAMWMKQSAAAARKWMEVTGDPSTKVRQVLLNCIAKVSVFYLEDKSTWPILVASYHHKQQSELDSYRS